MTAQQKKKMAEFYRACQEKGYTDMSDEAQSLKAKVIAMDLGLNYGNIAEFYAKAEACYQETEADKEAKEAAAREKAEKEAQEGELLLTIRDGTDKHISVYLLPDGSQYSRYNGGAKVRHLPTLKVEKGGTLSYTYHPSEAVYTGVTVGGVTTGGVSYTKEGYSAQTHSSNTGYIRASLGTTPFTVQDVVLSEYMQTRFRRDPGYIKFCDKNGIISCKRHVTAGSITSSLVGGMSMSSAMSAMSEALDKTRLPYSTCTDICSVLHRMIRAQFPPTDEEYYQKACALEKQAQTRTEAKDKAADLEAAKRIFERISDYKDADARAKKISAEYEEALQKSKEQKVLEREKAQKRNKKLFIILGAAAAVIAAAILIFVFAIMPAQAKSEYRAAFTGLNEGDTFTFGHYEQDNDLNNGKEPITWIVLKKENGRMLVISESVLDLQTYMEEESYFENDWEHSRLRKWLNGTFRNSAFSGKENSLIERSTADAYVVPSDVGKHGVYSGKDTKDKIFLLSVKEYEQYMTPAPCEQTAYQEALIQKIKDDKYGTLRESSGWWLRTTGDYCTYYVDYDKGELHEGDTINYQSTGRTKHFCRGVRPAMWIDVSWLG